MTYTFLIESSWSSAPFKVFAVLDKASYSDLSGYWGCIPGNFKVSMGGAFYYDPYRTLYLFSSDPDDYPQLKKGELIAKIDLNRRWVNTKKGDSGSLHFYPYGAKARGRPMTTHGWQQEQGNWQALDGFTPSWQRTVADAMADELKEAR